MKKARKTFRIFEAGAGIFPAALLRKALKSIEKEKNRKFIRVDKALNLNLFLKRTKLTQLPKNLTLLENCATKVLLQTPEKSQHVIFGSYLLNSLPKEDSCLLKGVPCDRTFCIAAEKALAPGGRLILVQDKLQEKFLQEIAGKLGLKIHAITIADEQAIKSKSPAVRMRSSPQKRIKFTKSELARMHLDTGKYLKGLKKLGIHNIEEATRPTIFLLRKSRKAKTRLESEIQDMNLVSQLIKGMFRQRE